MTASKPRVKHPELMEDLRWVAKGLAKEKDIAVDDLKQFLSDNGMDIPSSQVLASVFRADCFTHLKQNNHKRLTQYRLVERNPTPTWCGIAPFKAPCRTAGKYRDYAA